jgi:(methylthio)acryloyl-CoA hydratase
MGTVRAKKSTAAPALMSDKVVWYSSDATVAMIGLDRSKKRNALSAALSQQLREAVLRAYDEAKVGFNLQPRRAFLRGLGLG